MNQYVTYIKRYIEANPLEYTNNGAHFLQDVVFEIYKPTTYSKLKEKISESDQTLGTLSRKKRNRLVNTIVNVCEEQEKAAFLEGVKTGAQLILALNEELEE